MDTCVKRYEVRKTGSSTNPWWIHDTADRRSALVGGKTKKEVMLLCDTFNAWDSGDRDAWVLSVRTYYRHRYAAEKKRHKDDYKNHLMLEVTSLGWGPEIVGADPDTMEPL